ncbi:MBL fold metallo-hydrolase [Paraglaciecola arctica]|uniref:MBL fold metallo-hydrolase n=1 Tax=Paraglaciecola arctica TaxID=1128911 RepID=UPI001C07C99C|nr:3',5'-cyclic-nucleotide phosphodiesterase [Paraglaciecola arctica]MBU3004999.1 3',5'-cyclic-nucleotide phosphodiesterase [Paraglaciecola arctica]
MQPNRHILFIAVLIISFQLHGKQTSVSSNPETKGVFELVTLGSTGGIQDGNLSAFLLRTLSEPNYIALDAGTLTNGINVALSNNAFENLPMQTDNTLSTTGKILHHHIKGYLISHGHLDHVAGLLVASPEDNNKPIYGLKSVNQTMSDTYFNWQAWANFTDRGKPPLLNKYQVIDLVPQQTTNLKGTQLKVKAFSLSHPLESTAFVIEYEDNLFVYFGDTGPDKVEKQGKLAVVWEYLAKQMRTKKLRGVVIEVSFANDQPDNLLFGHLTPKWLLSEMHYFYSLVADKQQIKDMKVIISHIKYSLKSGTNPRLKIQQELNQGNTHGLKFILAKQGQLLIL